MLSSLKNWLGLAPTAEDLFAEAVRSVLAAEGASAYVYDRAKFAFVDGSKTIYLQSIFGRCRDMPPSAQVRLVQRFVRGALVAPREINGVQDLADDVVPLIRSRAEVALHRLVAEAAGAERPQEMDLASTPFVGNLVVTLGINRADTIQRLSLADLERAGMTVDSLLPRARANLRRLYPACGFAPFSASGSAPGLFYATEAETYQASMLLYPRGQVLQMPQVDGQPVLMVPTRDMMFLTGSDNTRGLDALLDLVFDKYLDWQHRCAPALWTWRDERLEEWQPARGTETHRRWSNCRAVGRATEYVMQKGALDALHRRIGEDIHVATYKMLAKDGTVHATCVWTEGVTDMLLPQTDTITFVPQSGAPFVVPWAAAERIAGHLLEASPEYSPRRVRVRAFPTPEQCAALEVIQVA